MRYLKSPAFVIGVLLTAAAIVATRPTIDANLQGFPDSSWNVSAPMRISLLHVGVLLAGLALIGTSVIRLRSLKNRD
jgi:hypothetical protein